MSRCIECGRNMDPCEASQFMECRPCRKRQKKATKIRTINDPGVEQIDRACIPSNVLGGQPSTSDLDEE